MTSVTLDAPMRRFWTARRQYSLPAAAVAIVLLLVLVPLLTLFAFSFRSGSPWAPGEFTFANYVNAYSTPQTYTIFFNTVLIGVVSTAISVGVALFFAFLTERTDMPFRNLAWGLLLIPLAMPGILFAVAWTFLLSPRIGLFNVWIRWTLSLVGIDLAEGPFDIYSLEGMIFLEGMRGVTTTFLIVVGAFRAMDPSLEEAARTSGASGPMTMLKVSIPLLTPAILAASMYSFMSHLESLEIPIIVGLPAKVFVFPSYIFFSTQRYMPPQYGLAAALGATFLVVSLLLVFWYRRVVGRGNRFATITGKGYRPRVIPLGRWRYPAFLAFVLYFVLAIAGPALILLWCSLLSTPMVPSWELLGDLSLRNYRAVLDAPRALNATVNTVVVTLATATLTMALAVVVAWATVRRRFKGAAALDALSFLPHSIPGIIIGIALVFVAFQPPFLYLRLFGGLSIIVLGLTISYIAFGSRTMIGAIAQIHADMEEAAMTSGAKWRAVMGRIVVPLLLPAFIGGWIWVASHAFRNFSIPLVLTSRDNMVLSVLMWRSWDDGSPGQTAALGVMLIAVLGLFTVAGRLLVTRLSRQQAS